MSYGVVIGRFQVPELTDGHFTLIDNVYAIHGANKVIVLLGAVSSPPNRRYPLPIEARKQIIRAEFPHAIIREIYDNPEDGVWIANADRIISEIVGDEEAIIYTGRDGAVGYIGRYPVKQLDFGISDVCGTEIRKECANEVVDSIDWRKGVIYAVYNQWPRTYLTVDMAMVRYIWGVPYVCMIRKPGADRWQFPGGFVELNESFTDAAAREMKEETGLESISPWKIVADFVIDDWRVRGVDGLGHKTVLCMGTADQGAVPIADDDVEEAAFMGIEALAKNADEVLKTNHRVLLDALMHHLDLFAKV
jgi:bifunctional NMN adenylyltransferase/nudix hydrolase